MPRVIKEKLRRNINEKNDSEQKMCLQKIGARSVVPALAQIKEPCSAVIYNLKFSFPSPPVPF